MVDPTKGFGFLQNILSGNKVQNTSEREEKKETKPAAEVLAGDEVSLSDEAISLSQAQQATEDTRVVLENNQDITLGLDPALLDQNV